MKLNAEKSWMSLGCMHFNSRKWQIQGEGRRAPPIAPYNFWWRGFFVYKPIAVTAKGTGTRPTGSHQTTPDPKLNPNTKP